MRWWTILAAAALALTVAGAADARPRFGPGMILRALPGPFAAMFGGARSRHVRRVRTERRSPPARVVLARDEQTVAQGAGRGVVQDARLGWTGPVFWPTAFDDMFGYASRLDGAGARFWSYGYGDVLAGMFAESAAGQPAPEASAAANPAAPPRRRAAPIAGSSGSSKRWRRPPSSVPPSSSCAAPWLRPATGSEPPAAAPCRLLRSIGCRRCKTESGRCAMRR